MKNKGFTLIELITTFALTSAIIVILTNIVLIIKDIYIKYEIKTEMLIKQGELSSYINDRITNGNLVSYLKEDENIYKFTVRNPDKSGDTDYTLTINENIITFDDYVYKIENGVTIGNITAPDTWSSGNLQIIIPITHKLFDGEDFGLNLVYFE